MLGAVEHRFGADQSSAGHHRVAVQQWSCYIAGDTRNFAREIGLEPRTTPIESPQSNGMAEAFVRTIKRDYVCVSPCPDDRHASVTRVDYSLQRGSPAQGARLSFTPASSLKLAEVPDRVRSFGGNNNLAAIDTTSGVGKKEWLKSNRTNNLI
jgi:transposase InsO family protein